MKDQPWDLNQTDQTCPVGQKWCQFTNAPITFRGPLPRKFGVQKISNFGPLFPWLQHSTLHVSIVHNETSHQQTKILVLIYNMFPKRLPTFCDLWLRNVWDPISNPIFSTAGRTVALSLCPVFAYCGTTFGGHCIATIKVAIPLVVTCFSDKLF